ncbi:MAG: ABC-2 family transporter protein [Clostridia bacterium]|nr:ABC-2 family transporter protein [Clostridia bacterium]
MISLLREVRHSFCVFAAYLRIGFRSIAYNTGDFSVGIVTIVFENALSLVLLSFVYMRVDRVAGWPIHDLLFLYAFNSLGVSLWSFFFINTITLPYYLRNGEFDRFLVRPLAPLAQILLDGLDEDSIGDIVVSVALLSITVPHTSISKSRLVLIAPLLICSCLIYAGMSILLSSLNFAFQSNANYANITMRLSSYGNYPLRIFPVGLRVVFTAVFPIGLASSVPFHILNLVSMKTAILWTAGLLAIAVAYFFMTMAIWNRLLRRYASVGS